MSFAIDQLRFSLAWKPVAHKRADGVSENGSDLFLTLFNTSRKRIAYAEITLGRFPWIYACDASADSPARFVDLIPQSPARPLQAEYLRHSFSNIRPARNSSRFVAHAAWDEGFHYWAVPLAVEVTLFSGKTFIKDDFFAPSILGQEQTAMRPNHILPFNPRTPNLFSFSPP